MFESFSDGTMLIAVDIIIIMTISALLGYTAYRILRNPFRYPYFIYTFDVSYKRNVDIADYVDGFLCDERNWDMLIAHQRSIIDWKETTEDYLASCVLKKHRTKQYRKILDDQRAFQFETVRGQTRYRQRNYIRSSYRVPVSDKRLVANWQWLLQRHYALSQIGYETTLKNYYRRDQRKLMTPALRRRIMKRDNYTCRYCGKYMPDEVGLHIDHIIPIAKGGRTVPSNLQVLCSKCNGRKGSRG